MLLAITQSPYTQDPNALYKILAGEEKTVHTESEEPYYEKEEFDKKEIEKLKFAMRGNDKIKIK